MLHLRILHLRHFNFGRIHLQAITPSKSYTFGHYILGKLHFRKVTPPECYTFGCFIFGSFTFGTLHLRVVTPSHNLKYCVRLDQDLGTDRQEIRPVTQLFACPGFCSERGAACHQQWWPEKKCVLILIENLGIIMACL